MRSSSRRLGALFVVGIAVCVGLPATVGADTAAVASSPPNLVPDPIPPLPVPGAAAPLEPEAGVSSPWQALVNPPPFCPGAMLLLTDGDVIVQDQCSLGGWWKLQPDMFGSYVNGTWRQIASLPAGYSPTYFASAVLPNGRVIIEGGEYNNGPAAWTNLGAIYDPLVNRWTPVPRPAGSDWDFIGDAEGIVLADGRFMLGGCCTATEALLDRRTLTWTPTGHGKADGNNEEGWTLLPNGDVLTVDTKNFSAPNNTEVYSPATGEWTSAGSTPVPLSAGAEIGPQVLRPDGTVFVAGATGANAVFNTATNTWSPAPSFPVIAGKQYDSADGAAAVLPNGRVLVDASPGEFLSPTHFFVFDGTRLARAVDPPNSAYASSYYGFMLVLPTGQVLYTDRAGYIGVYNSLGSAKPIWQPKIVTVPTDLRVGSVYNVSGRQLSGLTQGAAYGDDYQSATNYPLVRITNTATGRVVYARTSNIKGMSVAPNAPSSANFKVPADAIKGASTLVVVANGIASTPVSVTIT